MAPQLCQNLRPRDGWGDCCWIKDIPLVVLRFVRTDASRMKKHIAEVILAEAEPEHPQGAGVHSICGRGSKRAAACLRVKKSTLYFRMHKVGICRPGPSSPSPRLLNSDRMFIAPGRQRNFNDPEIFLMERK